MLSWVRTMLEEASRRRHGSSSSDDGVNPPSPSPTMSTQQSDDDIQQETLKAKLALSDQEMLERARAAHDTEDFRALSAGPEANGPWKRVEASDRFVVFRRQVTAVDNEKNELEIMCAGRLDASLEEVAGILRSSSETEDNAVMNALYTKSFIFGSFEREVPCLKNQDQPQVEDNCIVDNSEHLAVKTKSFARTTMLGHNEQWCYFDYYQRKKERDGFTISRRALPPLEITPGRIVDENTRVHQLHGLSASCLVDNFLTAVACAWCFMRGLIYPKVTRIEKNSRRRSQESARSSSSPVPSLRRHSFDYGETNKHKAQLRRLLAMARGSSLSSFVDVALACRFQQTLAPNTMRIHAVRAALTA